MSDMAFKVHGFSQKIIFIQLLNLFTVVVSFHTQNLWVLSLTESYLSTSKQERKWVKYLVLKEVLHSA
jgi:hypothetical protein